MACVSIGTWLCTRTHSPAASLTLLTGSSRNFSSAVSLKMAIDAQTRSRLLHCSFVPTTSLSLSSASTFSSESCCDYVEVSGGFVVWATGSLMFLQYVKFSLVFGLILPVINLGFFIGWKGFSLGLDLSSNIGVRREKGHGLVVRAGKAALCQTKRNRSRKSLARTHGFHKRMSTTSGRAVLKRRRAKGRWVLCTKSNHNSGKRP